MNNLQNNQKSDATPMGYDSLLPTVFPCKKIRAGKYLYRGWIIGCAGYYHPEKRVVWEGYDPESGNADFHGFSKAEIKMMIDDDLSRNCCQLAAMYDFFTLCKKLKQTHTKCTT